jgi:aspartyl-tRNA(Asn)/glutamyl-tRNA(Gln) amidotransferase subunit B
VNNYGLSRKDAGTIISLDDGDRLDYFFEVTEQLAKQDAQGADALPRLGRVVGNW